ncbi:FAD/NAD(P)-binding protein [Legionella brunensis]|uniref:Hydrogenase/sulfur reductase subunit gamma n=1 Tax=Legionella brunensis TaxID=29422 RepID=A0A0W0ST86_9GAMM|nr:FAD/NAD(P)-binding protein [Legionella brunensis]KTC86558.1 hydrogenase/sulfur reductase subunit gamma [Legionella brunensis]
MISSISDAYLPQLAKIKARRQESPTIFTLETCFVNSLHQHFAFYPGQFNMLYMYGVGEVAISISSDPDENSHLSHTIRAVGRVTRALQTLKEGDLIGIRGPYGQGWPLREARGKDVVIVTGGLGCAPTIGVINYISKRRKEYGALKILQGVKHSDDLIFRKQYEKWQELPSTEIYVAADQAGPTWPWKVGYVTDMINLLHLQPNNTIVMMCGPQGMMFAAILALLKQGISEKAIYLSVERNMECGLGHCGHCQYGGLFVCKDGPVFAYPKIKALFSEIGF